MMAGDYLGFLLGGRRHAIPMARVREVMKLPLVQPTERAPGHVLGLFNLRGSLVPVLDLGLLLDLPLQVASPEDHLLVFAPTAAPEIWAVCVEEVDDLLHFEPGELSAPPEGASLASCVVQLGLKEERLYHLLDLEALVGVQVEAASGRFEAHFGQLSDGDGAILRARAQDAAGGRSVQATGQVMACATFRLSGETFALDIRQVLHIATCPPIHAVPGTPEALLGLTNHRGEPLLVADLRPLLGMRPASPQPEGHLVVVEDGEARLGLYVDEVGEVLEVDPGLLLTHPGGPEGALVQGTWLAEGTLTTLLSHVDLLAHPGLSVFPA